jgi:hypothetical protein
VQPGHAFAFISHPLFYLITMHYPSPAALTVSCFGLPLAEFLRRTDAAEALEAAKRAEFGKPEANYGREIMWHPAFAAECVALLSNMPLPEITTWLREGLAETMHKGGSLDLTDYGYLADVLREGLASEPTPLAALRLARALAWVEQAALLPVAAVTSAPIMTASAA